MTREEAIAFFRDMNECTYGNVEPIQMAIKALEQEPCEDVTIDKHYWKGFNNGIRTEKFRESKRQELCEDFISRQAAINIVKDMYGLARTDVLSDAVKQLKDLPSVTPQPFINKPCVSEGVCREDKIQVLDKIRAEIEQLTITEGGDDYVRKMAELFSLKMKVLHIIDKYKAESED